MLSKINIFSRKSSLVFSFFALFLLSTTNSFAIDGEELENHHADSAVVEGPGHNPTEHEKFKAGPMIVEHINDSHQWHLFGDHKNPVHFPLPVILWTSKGLEIFSSSHVEHHEDVYTTDKFSYILHDEHIEIIDPVTHQINDLETARIYDFSITKTAFALMITAVLMLLIFMAIAKSYKKNAGKGPRGLASFMEPLIMFIRDDVAKTSIGPKYERFMPYLLTAFFFIFISNLTGLIPLFPFGANICGTIAVPLVLAVITFFMVLFSGNAHYWRHIFAMPGVPIPVLIILTPIELIGVVLRPFVLMVRLFANIAAGHIIALAFYSLIFIFADKYENAAAGFGVSIVSILFTVFMGMMELLVAFLQAYVFTLLSAIYIGSAVEEGHHEHEHHAEHGHETVHVVA